MRSRTAEQLVGTSRQIEIPPPVGGLNTRDSFAAMPNSDAVIFTNVVSEPSGVRSRLGSAVVNSDLSGATGYMQEYISGTDRQLIVGSGTALYSLDGSLVDTTIGTGFSNSNWQSAQIGANMVLVNGTDAPRLYDGTTLTTGSYSGDITTPTAASMDGVHLYGNRIYMWDSQSGDFYYGATDAIQGAFTKFPLSLVSQTTGNILMMETITRDGGDGVNDYAVFILSTGEVIVYQGTNPASASTWALVGRYFIPAPIGQNCAVRLGADILVLTRNDVVALSEVMQSSAEGQGFVISPSKISGAIGGDFATYGSNDGFSLSLYGSKGWVIVNIPETANLTYHQYVNVTTTRAASRFEGWSGSVFASFNNNLYYALNGTVYQADVGFDDNGNEIECRAQQGFTTLDVPNRKNVKSGTVRYLSDASVSVGFKVAYDYNLAETPILSGSETVGVAWDDGDWDDFDWGGAAIIRSVKHSVSGTGVAIAPFVAFNISGADFKWLGTNLNMQFLRMI